jgi:hypothetical protein
MRLQQRRVAGLLALSSGLVLASGCDVADQVLATVAAALRIVDIWV